MNLSPAEIVDEIAVRVELVNVCAAAGGINYWAPAHKFDPAYVRDVMHGRRSPSHKILDALGYEKLTRYRKSFVSSPGVSLPGVGNSPTTIGAFSSS